MPGKGIAWPVSDDWKKAVRKEIDRLIADENSEIGSDSAVAKLAGINRSTLHDLLGDDTKQSPHLPKVNKALSWPAPRVLSTPDELELWAAADALGPQEVGRLLEKAEAKVVQLRAAKRRT